MRNKLILLATLLAFALCCEAQNTTIRPKLKKTTTPSPKQKNSTTSRQSDTSATTRPAVSRQEHEGYVTFTVEGIAFDMVLVEGGTFMMGGNYYDTDVFDTEKPCHQVTLSDYYIGKTEVTQALWQAVMGSNPSGFSGDKLPVENVSWNSCQTFINKLNELTGETFALPTEAEWEFAARGGNKSRGYMYSGSNSIDDVAWYKDNSGNTTHAVGTKQANELGLYDMTGNVSEWCADWFNLYDSSAQTDPTGPSNGMSRVFRRGSWDVSARFSRVYRRSDCDPASIGKSLGLRLSLRKK